MPERKTDIYTYIYTYIYILLCSSFRHARKRGAWGCLLIIIKRYTIALEVLIMKR